MYFSTKFFAGKKILYLVPPCLSGEEDNPEIVCYEENKAHIETVYSNSFDVVIPFSDTEIFGENPDTDSVSAQLGCSRSIVCTMTAKSEFTFLTYLCS